MTSPRPRDPEEEADLVPIDVYRKRVLAIADLMTPAERTLDEAGGCVAASDVYAPFDLPPFVSSAMDGFAILASDVADATPSAPVELRIVGEVRMGRRASTNVGAGRAVAVPTGGMMPNGADAVVPIEFCVVDGERVAVVRPVASGKHVRPAGEDVRAGDLVVRSGRRLGAPEIGALAACGIASVEVHPPPRVAVVSTGDEIVPVGRPLGAGQIHDSNLHALIAAVRETAAVTVDGGIARDDPDELVLVLDRLSDDVDAIVCTGGVSAGERDPVKRAFVGSGDVTFANVAMQPGRPQACGRWRGTPFFGLPGNPVSAVVSFEVFVRPALMKMMGRTDGRREVTAVLRGELDAPRTRTRFARVRVRREDDAWIATPEGGHQSNLLVTFARADGLAEVPAGTRVRDGEGCRVVLLRDV